MRKALQIASLLTLACAGYASSQSGNHNFKSAADGGVRYFEVIEDDVPLFTAPSSASEVEALLPRGSLLTNFGCVPDSDKIWCEIGLLGKKDRGFVDTSQIQPSKSADGTVPRGPDDSTTRARKKDFDIVEQIKCAQIKGESLGNCRIQIARAGGGDATAVVTFSNSFTRELYFRLGTFVRANTTMSGVGRDIDWALRDGMYILRVDDQRFEIPASFIVGP